MAKKEATLTHKVRNPQNLNSWLDIWTATVSADFGENNARTNETIVIAPSNNWQIPITQISDVTVPTPTTDEPNKTGPQKNVSIIDPKGEHIAITKDDGSIYEGPAISADNAEGKCFLNDLGQWAQINTSFTVDLETVIEDDQEKPTSNAEFKVGDNSVIVKPQGKLAFSSVVNNKTINLSLGPIGTEDIKEKTIKLGNLDLEGLKDPDHPELGIEFKLPAENIKDIPATQIINFDTAVNSAVKTNTKDNAGIVAKGEYNISKAWLTDSDGNPSWRKVTADHMDSNLELNEKLKDNSISGSKFNTKLLGVFISKDEPYYNSYIDDLYSNPDTMEFRHITVTQDVEATFTDVGTITETMRLTMYQNNNTIEISYIDKFANQTVSRSASINMLPDPLSVLYECTSKASRYWNNTETKSPGYVARFISTLHDQIGNYLTSCLTEPENHPEITYRKISDIFSSDLNKWDYEHCGIWVEI